MCIRDSLALDCTINNDSVFARKNYFYPDMPYNYQISQFERPLCEFGHLDINVGGETKRIGITRIHMETDAGKNIHEGDHSYLDLNRAAVPLIEIVSEPDMRSAEEAVAYLKALHAIVVYLGITDGNMEEGSFRCDANVSIRPKGAAEFGTRAELKNLNSFRHVQKAIEYEVSRQQDVLEDGDKVIQETRLFDSVKGVTMSMRDKEAVSYTHLRRSGRRAGVRGPSAGSANGGRRRAFRCRTGARSATDRPRRNG